MDKLKVLDNKAKKRCALCGNTKGLVKTDCCDNWICDDTSNYKLFSYAKNSCYRNHDRYTLCSYHYHNDHKGHWQDCKECKKSFETEMYVYYGTNEYNFEKLKKVPKFQPTKCKDCEVVIDLGNDGYTQTQEGCFCAECAHKRMSKTIAGKMKEFETKKKK